MSEKQDLFACIKYFQAAYRYRYLFFPLAILITTLIIAYSYTLPKKYRADSVVFIEKNVIANLVKGIAVTPDMRDRIRVLKYALSSRELINRVLTELDSDIFTKSEAEQQMYIDKLKERTSISIRGNELFTVSLVDKDPLFAQKYVNALVKKYVEENLTSKRDETYGANRFLEEQIALFKKKLEAAEDAIIQFRKKNGIYFSLDEKSVLEDIKKFKQEIEKLDLTIETTSSHRRALQKQLKTLSPTTQTMEMFNLDDPFGGGGDSEIEAKEAELKKLLVRCTENHPEVIMLKAEIEELKRRQAKDQATDTGAVKEESLEPSSTTSMPNLVYQQVEQQLLQVSAELETLKARKASLEKLVAKREQSLREIPVNRKELTVLTQERDSVKTIYQELLQRLGQSEVSKQMEIGDKTATFRIVDPARFPQNPVSPNMPRMIFLAIVAGLGGAFGLVFLLDLLDTSIRDPHQLEGMGVRMLATIPNIEDKQVKFRTRKRDLFLYGFAGIFYGACLVLMVIEMRHIDLLEQLKNLLA